MTPLCDFDQAVFTRALLDPDLSQTGAAMARRFDVYRNNVVAGLVDALSDRFPVCLRLVGDAFFRAMAQTYMRASLPRTPMLLEYGADFANFVSIFEPASGLPYLSDVARLEYAAGLAYHAVDVPPLSREALRTLPPERLEAVTASLHPSVQIVRSTYPIVSIWRENTSSDSPGAVVVLDRAEDALVVRPRCDVEIRVLSPGGAEFVESLMGGGTFGEANRAGQIAKDFDLTGCLATLLACDAFLAISIGHSGVAGITMERGTS